MFIIRFSVFVLLTVAVNAMAAQQDAIHDFVEQAMDKGLNSEEFTPRSYFNLISETEKHLAGIPEDTKDKHQKYVRKILKLALKQLKDNRDSDPAQLVMAYFSSLRAIYGLMASAAMENDTSKDNRESTKVIKTPYIKGDKLNQPIGLEQALLESRDLLLPGDATAFATAEELAELTPIEVSELDISSDHPAWFPKSLREEKRNHLQTIRNWAEVQTSKDIKKKGLPKISYELEKAKRVLFFSDIKDSATSPKMNAHDNYGVKWKLKWGSEIDIEPMANCLYVKAGAKFTDIVIANDPGKMGVTLILDKEGAVSNLRGFKKAFKESHYKFDVTSHIMDSGVISAENVQSVLSELPSQAPYAKNTKADLIGRTYITFKSSMVEFKGKAGIERIGPAAFGQAGANTDRMARGSIVFNQWIWNGDTKDDNNRVVMVKGFDGKKQKRFLEAQHDLGTSMGHPFEKGNPNSLEHDNKFIYIKTVYEEQTSRERRKKLPRVLMESNVIFDQYTMYTPRSYANATYSDARWMAERLVSISTEEIRSCARESKMPDFMVEAFTNKLAIRRNLIAQAYKVPVSAAEKNITVPEIEVPLETLEDRKAAAARYKLSLDDLNREMMRLGLLKKADGNSRYKKDVLMTSFKNDYGFQVSEIPLCHKNVLMGLIVDKVRSSGLVRRLVPKIDQKPLKRCEYGGRNLGKAYPKTWGIAKGIAGVN